MTEVHVVPDDRTATWRVQDHDAAAPVSEHTNAAEAELAARAHADVRGAERIVVHDRYHQTYDDAPAPAQLRARTQQERARQLAAVRTMQRGREQDDAAAWPAAVVITHRAVTPADGPATRSAGRRSS